MDSGRGAAGQFQVSFNENGDFFSNLLTGIKIKPGVETTASVTVTRHVVSDDFRDLPLEVRRCKFSYESSGNFDDGYFTNYTQKGCRYICSVKHRIAELGCIPWDNPSLNVSTK